MDEIHFESFDSFEEMMNKERERQAKAYKWITDNQWDIADGKKHWFVQPVPTSDHTIYIFGWSWDWDKEQEELEAETNEETRAELEYEIRHYREALTRGFIFAKTFAGTYAYEHELGSVHISQIVEITEREFLMAKSIGWFPLPMTYKKILDQFDRVREMMTDD